MKALRLGILAAFFVSLVTAVGVSRISAKEIVEHRIVFNVDLENGKPARDGMVIIFKVKDNMLISPVRLNEWGTGSYQMREVEGKYCFRAEFQGRHSSDDCYEDEYPARVKITIP